MIRRPLIFTVLLAGIVAGVCVLAVRIQRLQPVQLTNGSSVLLLGVTVGTNAFTTVKWWRGYAQRWLPEKLQTWIPRGSTSALAGDTNSITVWLKVLPRRIPSSHSWSSMQAQDQAGRRYDYLGSFSSDSDGKYGILIRTFPRRASSFNIVFYDSNTNEMGKLRVPNPIKGPFPKWIAEALPVTHTNGPVALKLNRLNRKWPNEPDRIAPVWEVQALDPLWDGTLVRSWSLYDATGNRSWLLIPGESLLKIQALVHRVQPEAFLSDERLTLTNLVVPADGELLPIARTATLAGVQVFLLALAGAGELAITNGTFPEMRTADSGTWDGKWSSSSSGSGTVETWGSTKPFFVVELGPLPPETEVFFKLRNTAGDEIKSEESHGSEGRLGGSTRQIRFDRSQAGKHVSLNGMVSRGRVFEFIVNPADAAVPNP